MQEEHLSTLVYQLPPTGLKLSEVFRVLEGGKEHLDISDYSLSQTTLDDVFIHFASMQSEDVELSGEERGKRGRKITRHRVPLSDVVANSSGVSVSGVGRLDVM